jgi:hypothetical protein
MKLSARASLIFLGIMFCILAGWTSPSNASFINLADGSLTLDWGGLEIVITNDGLKIDTPQGEIVISNSGLQATGTQGGMAINNSGI